LALLRVLASAWVVPVGRGGEVLGLTFAQRETPVTDKYIEKAGEHESSAGAAAINWWSVPPPVVTFREPCLR
jgi:hypothetical protein